MAVFTYQMWMEYHIDRPVGRNIRDILDIQKFMRENNAIKIEIDKKAIEHLRMV